MIGFFKENLMMRRAAGEFAPRPGFKGELQRRIMAEMPVGAAIPRSGRLVYAGVISTLVLALGATGVYAYSSPEVTPENPLYAVKRGIESAEEVAAFTPEMRVLAQERRIAHRIAEAERLSGRNVRVDGVMKELEREFAAPAGKPGAKAAELAERADGKVLAGLEAIAAKNPAAAFRGVKRIIIQDARRIEERLASVEDDDERKVMMGRLDRRRETLENIVSMIRNRRDGGAAGVAGRGMERLEQELERMELELDGDESDPAERQTE